MATSPIGRLALNYISERARRGNVSPSSARQMRWTLGVLVREVGWELPADRLRRCHIEQWLARKPLAKATQRNQMSTVRGFAKWMVQQGHARRDPTIEVVTPRQPRSVPRGQPRPVIDHTISVCPDARGVLIVTLEVQQGLRACEVVSLELGDIDADQRLMLVRGKGGHERVLPILDPTWRAMERYLAEHPAAAGPLVRSYSRPNEPISAAYCSKLVSSWMRQAGATATGHALRHTAATDMLRAGAHVRDVQNALGHASLATTQRYLPWVVGDLRAAMSGREYGPPPSAGVQLQLVPAPVATARG